MKASDFRIGGEVRVFGRYNVFVRCWKARVVALPAGGAVLLQRISLIDASDVGEPREAFTRDCQPMHEFSMESLERDEESERKYLARYNAIIEALKKRGVPYRAEHYRPNITFSTDAFEALEAFLAIP